MKVTKKDKINDKLLAIALWANRIERIAMEARELDQKDQIEKCEKAIHEVLKISKELWLMWKTDEEKGRAWQWWE